MKLTHCFRTLAVCAGALATLATAQTVTVVEYRNKTLHAYFITGRAAEQAALDAVPDFVRTGMSFQGSAAATAPSTFTRVCRFYVSIANPFVSSHFYGRQGTDCKAILALNPAGFSYEGFDFAAQVPANLVCPPGTMPVYRSFRALANGLTSNHRYTVTPATYTSAASAGYALEGAQFCVTLVADVAPAGSWTGTASGTLSSEVIVETSSASLTWTLESTTGNIAVYRPRGTVSSTFASLVGCADAPILDPASHPLNPATDGILTVDYNSTPPTYHGSGLSTWLTTLTCTNNFGARVSTPWEGEPDFFGGSRGSTGVEAGGTVSADGLTIQGSDSRAVSTLGQQTFHWKFTRN